MAFWDFLKTDEENLYRAAGEDNFVKVKELIEKGASVNTAPETYENTTPLCAAAHEGHKEMVEFLIAKGADVNHQNDEGNSPLLFASQHGHSQTVKTLLENGADQFLANTDRNTALHSACFKGHLDVVKVLLDNGADLNKTVEGGASPLAYACGFLRKDVVLELIKRGANLNLKCGNAQSTPLFLVVGVKFSLDNDDGKEVFEEEAKILERKGQVVEIIDILLDILRVPNSSSVLRHQLHSFSSLKINSFEEEFLQSRGVLSIRKKFR